jgi:hypothetical protein
LLGPFVLITWLFLTARATLRAKVWRAFRFRHPGLTSVLTTLVLRPFQIVFLRHSYVSLSCIPSGLLLCFGKLSRDTIAE